MDEQLAAKKTSSRDPKETRGVEKEDTRGGTRNRHTRRIKREG